MMCIREQANHLMSFNFFTILKYDTNTSGICLRMCIAEYILLCLAIYLFYKYLFDRFGQSSSSADCAGNAEEVGNSKAMWIQLV